MSAVLERPGATPLDESLARLRRLASPYVGIVRAQRRLLAAPGDSRLFRVACEVAADDRLLGQPLAHLSSGGGGSGTSWEHATAAALGEAVERYSATWVPHDALVEASALELGEDAVHPDRFALYHPSQHEPGFPFVPFTRATRVRWTRGVSLSTGRTVWLPAQLVYLGDTDEPAGGRVAHSTSNGAACGATFAEAALSGLFELVERDAFQIAWLARLSLPRLAWRADRALARLAERYFDGTGGEFVAVDLSCFADLPVVLALVRGDGRRLPALCIGASAAATAQEAWLKALAEAFSVRAWAQTVMHDEPDRRFAPPFDEIRRFADHIHLYALPEHAPRAAFLAASPVERAVADVPALPGATPQERLDSACGRLAAQGLETYAVDVTSPDVAAAGLAVVKTVVPELCPLDVDHRIRFLGGERIYDVPRRLGLRARRLELADLNPDPHPFP